MRVAIIILVTFLVACVPEPKAQGEILKVKFAEKEIASGQSTDLIIEARNAGPNTAEFKFVLVAEGNPQFVQLEHPTKLAFNLRPKETSGERRVRVTATSSTVTTKYKVVVEWQDAEGRVLDEDFAILSVNKIQGTSGLQS